MLQPNVFQMKLKKIVFIFISFNKILFKIKYKFNMISINEKLYTKVK